MTTWFTFSLDSTISIMRSLLLLPISLINLALKRFITFCWIMIIELNIKILIVNWVLSKPISRTSTKIGKTRDNLIYTSSNRTISSLLLLKTTKIVPILLNILGKPQGNQTSFLENQTKHKLLNPNPITNHNAKSVISLAI